MTDPIHDRIEAIAAKYRLTELERLDLQIDMTNLVAMVRRIDTERVKELIADGFERDAEPLTTGGK